MAGSIGECMARHRHRSGSKFLNAIDAQTPAQLDLHLIVDNYSTHKHPKVQKWLARHPSSHPFHPHEQFVAQPHRRWFRD